MSIWWISEPRRSSASRMCQDAWAPAPKTVIEWTEVRRERMMDEARAVRKAVIASADRKA